jgi:probable rRNA maturation factor
MKRISSPTPGPSAPAGAPRLALSVQYAVHDDSLPSRPSVRRWVRAACGADAQVTVRFVDAEEGRALNLRYRGKDYPTNVLSFPYETEPTLLGDIALCVPVIGCEAQAQGKPPAAHYAHLVVHGMLHLQGYDHESKEDAAVMEAREREVLAGLGYPDPYASHP